MSDKLSFRPARSADFDEISLFPRNAEELFRTFPSADYPLTAAQMLDIASVRTDPTVVTVGSRVAAYANFIKVRPGKFCSIGNIIVSDQDRGAGVGEYLMSVMERTALEKYKAKEVSVACFSRNKETVEFYTRLGYRPYETEKRTDKSGHMAILIKFRKEVR